MNQQELARKNRRVLLNLGAIVLGMSMLAYASPTLYNAFCRVTGFGGTTQVAASAPDKVLDRTIRIKFNADVNPELPWQFKPGQREVSVKVGEEKLTAYHAVNDGTVPLVGTAVYNVMPEKAGRYFFKTQCFCFEKQTLQTGQAMDFPIMFFVDPSMNDDPNLRDVTEITLSYTFFEDKSAALERAKAAYYQEENRPAGG